MTVLILWLALPSCRGDDSVSIVIPPEAAPSDQESPCEIPEESQRNWYTGQGRYSIALCGGVIEVTLRLRLTGEFVTDDLRERYRTGIEEIWSTERFEVPIKLNVVWDDEVPDWTIEVKRCVTGWNTARWCTGGWIERSAAHEAGHYLGLFDEYGGGDAQGFDGGSAPGPRERHEQGLMSNCLRPTLDYYYDAILLWHRGFSDEGDLESPH